MRQFKISDLDKVVSVNKVCLPENYSSYFFIDIFERFPETFIVAEENGELLGYIMCRIETGLPSLRKFEFPKIGHIISIAVLPQYRKRGVGFALIRKALEVMAGHCKAKECYLEVRTSNLPAINLYKKLDFKITRTEKSYYANGENAYIMTKPLPLEE